MENEYTWRSERSCQWSLNGERNGSTRRNPLYIRTDKAKTEGDKLQWAHSSSQVTERTLCSTLPFLSTAEWCPVLLTSSPVFKNAVAKLYVVAHILIFILKRLRLVRSGIHSKTVSKSKTKIKQKQY